MEANKVNGEPSISGVPEEMQNTIKTDLEASAQQQHNPLPARKVGFSVSDNEDLEELGYSAIHLRDLAIEIVRNLLVNGRTVVYGGNLNDKGFTHLFSDLAYQYRDKSEAKQTSFENYFAYPTYCLLSDEDLSHFKKHRTKIIKVPPPIEAGVDSEKFLEANTLDAKVIWAMSLTAMRHAMISNTDARILVGGKTNNYQGRMPGIIEEAMFACQQNKPLYLIGALGGASAEVIKALYGKTFSYMDSEYHQSAEYKAFRDHYHSKTSENIDADAVAVLFKEFGLKKLSALNGLTEDENERLFTSSNLPEMLYYISRGLKNIFA